ncbi:hypothetical protein B0H10DRAFT_2013888 [Mycena sp. CBHHK59/15]|nr:hypothetical protein B0H10DRAFT_2013888 [Mycena sp. CBHHK59/15]
MLGGDVNTPELSPRPQPGDTVTSSALPYDDSSPHPNSTTDGPPLIPEGAAIHEVVPEGMGGSFSVLFGHVLTNGITHASVPSPHSPPATPTHIEPLELSALVHDDIIDDGQNGAPEPCASCGEPLHEQSYNCPAWRLSPPSSNERNCESWFTGDAAAASEAAYPAPPSTHTPPVEEERTDSPEPAPYHEIPHAGLVLHNLRQVLGLDPAAPENWEEFAKLARNAVTQA